MRDYLRLAYRWSKHSDDPSTQLGALVVDSRGDIIGSGCNRLPVGVSKHTERLVRPAKYQWLIHAEVDAIVDCARRGRSTTGCTLYCPWFACCDCAKVIVNAGITKVVGHQVLKDKASHWNESIAIGDQMLDEAGVEREYFDGVIGECQHLFNGEVWLP